MADLPNLAAQRRRFFVAAPLLLALCGIFALLLMPVFPLSFRQSVSGVGLLVGGLVGAFSCGMRSVQSTGRRRRSWRLLMVAAVVVVAGNLIVSVTGADPTASPGTLDNIAIAIALVLSIIALLSFPTDTRRGIDLALMALDALVVGGSVVLITSVLVYSKLIDAPAEDLGYRPLAMAFPALDAVLVTVAVLLVVRRGADRPALALVAFGFLMYAVSDLTFAVQTAEAGFTFGTPTDLGWIAGYLAIAAAAWYPSAPDHLIHTERSGGSDALGTIIEFSVLLAAAVVQIFFVADAQIQGTQAVVWLFLVLAAGTRQTLLALDNTALRRGLEQRVEQQTAHLRRLNRQTEVLLTSVGDGIYGVDDRGRITFINPSGAEALGYNPADLLGRNAHDEFHAPRGDGHAFPWQSCYVTEAIRDGVVANAEEDVYVRIDGEAFPVEITASPLRDDERLLGAVVVFRDVTQRREVERMKNEFLSVVSHELRTPLTSIRGALGLLAAGTLGTLTPRAARMTAIALESSERLTRLINDILDLERMNSGTQPMEIVPCEVEELLAAAETGIHGLVSSTGVRVEVNAFPDRVLADPDRIVQTLTNLLGNAIKYSSAGGVVRMGAERHAGEVWFHVIDSGRGIPHDKLETIFERFAQVDSSDARQKGGTGLGLPISRHIVEGHGGRIWAESEPGHGATVRFTLPAVRSALPEGEDQEAGGPTILICDDDSEVVQTFSLMLREHGYQTIGVTDGQEAIERASADRPAAVLLDLMMPGTTGAQVVAALKGHQRTSHIPIVVISGMGPGVDPSLATRTEGWLIKPVSEDRLLDAVALAVEDRHRDTSVLVVEDDENLAGVLVTLLANHGLSVVHETTVAAAVARTEQLQPQVIVLDLALPDGDGSEVVEQLRRNGRMEGTALIVYSAADVEPDQRGALQFGQTVFLTKGRAGPEKLEDTVLELVDAVTGRNDRSDLD